MNINPSAGNSKSYFCTLSRGAASLSTWHVGQDLSHHSLNTPVRPLLRPSSLPHVACISAFVGKLEQVKQTRQHTKQKIRYSTFGSAWCMPEVGA